MQNKITYITIADALRFHKHQIDTYGGSNGVRDEGALMSALLRPQTGYYNDIIEEASALWESLSQNHPFVDGNKRTALVCTFVFLEINGYSVDVDEDILWNFIDDAYTNHTFEFKNIKEFLAKYTKQI